MYNKHHTVDKNLRVRPAAPVANPLGKPPEGADAIITTVRATRALSVILQEAGVLVVGYLPFTWG